MTRRLSLFLAVLVSMTAVAFSCQQQDNNKDTEEEGTEVRIVPIKITVPIENNWIFETRPSITMQLENPNSVEAKVEAMVTITRDTKEGDALTWTGSADIPANGSVDIRYTDNCNLDPGFYNVKCTIKNNGKTSVVKEFNIGISPFQLVSNPDRNVEEFWDYWNKVKAQLPAVNENNVKFIELESKSSSDRKVYMVEYKSVPNEEGGEPETIRGYYCEPTDGKKHPVLFHFYGYDDQKPSSKAYCPKGEGKPYGEFYVSTRGQMVNNRTAALRNDGLDVDFVNTYGDWFEYNFGKYDGYYYRGAFMDCVQAVRIAASRPTTDTGKLFAEGSSQGGALSYATATLSDNPFVAIAPNVAFLGDFPDYFKIVSWPANTAKKGQKKMNMTDEQMYEFLSYFDTKNMAQTLSCAVIAHIGLQDTTCPPHTNIAPYNNLKTPEADKAMYFSPLVGHGYHPNWESLYMDFFKKRGLE